ncbi:unnamed protein product [Bursaphelenchus xylophilus]|uniref:(pine wood nematode) hypothetical protein n=1 Tax=Bursaphelenchus xylophilus TaxID=6326 RepID=A0A1I7SUL0_BURXY|nr:unnamed protein product [Bursaphelenchus xylophilus]CAG9118612.1 unnamed protein product [Bursaphelenchus xylophilus]
MHLRMRAALCGAILMTFMASLTVYCLDNCIDEEGDKCQESKLMAVCGKPEYKRLMTSKCRKACGFCQPGTCTDTTTECGKPSISDICNHPTYLRMMRMRCPATCGHCDGDEKPNGGGNPDDNKPDDNKPDDNKPDDGDDECIEGAE